MTTNIDILDRQPFVERLIQLVRYLADNHRGCTFAIDGQWGSGKSFVLDMFEKQISLFQSPEAAGDRYILFHYNCWQYDFYEEPAIAIVTAMRDEILKYQKLIPNPPKEIRAALSLVSDLGKDLIENIVESKLGFSPFKTWERYKAQQKSHEKKAAGTNKFDSFFDFKIALDKTRDRLSKAAKEKPIIVIVDELDRCIPEYAIKILERLHHLFNDQENIIVVLAVDEEQLSTAVENIYGISGEDKVAQYLQKFISFTIHLDIGNVSDKFFLKYQIFFSKFDIPERERDNFELWTRLLFDGIDVRTQEKIMEHIIVLHHLSFKRVAGIYIFYFELLTQFLPIEIITHFLKQCTPRPYQEVENAEFKEVTKNGIVAFLSVVLQTFKQQNVITKRLHPNPEKGPIFDPKNERAYRSMIEDSKLIPFWIFDTIGFVDTTSKFGEYLYFKNASKYSEEVKAAHKFYKLSKLITLSDFNGER